MSSEATQNEHDGAASVAAPPRRRLQFSLMSLLWLTAFFACLAAICVMYRDLRKAKSELQGARDEVQKYRGEMGYLNISDPTRVYARGIRSTDYHKLSWRLYLPNGRQYLLCFANSGIGAEGFPVPEHYMSMDSEEHILDFSFIEGGDEKWPFHVKVVDGSGMSLEMNPVFRMSTHTDFVNQTQQAVSDSEGRLVLWRSFAGTQPGDGFMMWIEPWK